MSVAPAKVGPYEIRSRLGAGGMGEAYIAVKRGLGDIEQRYCLKLIGSLYARNESYLKRFMREAEITSTLRHPNIVSLIDSGRTDDGVPYIVLELVDGADLRMIMRHLGEWKVPVDEVIHIALSLARALHHAHTEGGPEGKGLLHRDLSPGNILISRQGDVKLSDFGVAKALSHGNLTRPGDHAGKLPYAPPEQLEDKKIGPRSDLYSLGSILHELLAGRTPYKGANIVQLANAMMRGDRANLRELADEDTPKAFLDIVESLIEVDPEKRMQSAQELIDALEPLAPPPRAQTELGALAGIARDELKVDEPLEPPALPQLSGSYPTLGSRSPNPETERSVSISDGLVKGRGGFFRRYGKQAFAAAVGMVVALTGVLGLIALVIVMTIGGDPERPDPSHIVGTRPETNERPEAPPDPPDPPPDPPETPPDPPPTPPPSDPVDVRVRVMPALSSVWVDGERVHRQRWLELTPGDHTLSCITPTRFHETLHIEAGEAQCFIIAAQRCTVQPQSVCRGP